MTNLATPTALETLKKVRDALAAVDESLSTSQTAAMVDPWPTVLSTFDHASVSVARAQLDIASDAILRAIVRLGGWSQADPISQADRDTAADPRA